MSRYAVTLDVGEELNKEQKPSEVDINIKQLEKQLEQPKQEHEEHHSHHEHQEEVHITLEQLENKIKEPEQKFEALNYETSYNNQGGFFNFIKNHKIAVFLIILIIFGYFYLNNDQTIVDNKIVSQDLMQLNLNNKNKSIAVLDSILISGLTATE